MILANAWVVTMDDARGEFEHGFVRIEDGLVAEVGAGEPPGPAEDLGGARRHPRPRQHPPPPLPDADARPRAGRRPLHLAAHALPGLGADRRGDALRGRAHRSRRARALGLHDRLRPPLRLPARRSRPHRGRDPAARELGVRHRRLARLDGPRRLRRRPAAGQPGRGDRRGARRHRAPRRARRRRSRPDRRRAVLAVLGHDAADGGVGGARAPSRPRACTPTSPRRSRRRPTAARLYGCSPVEYLERVGWLAPRRLVRPLRPPLAGGDRAASPRTASASRTARPRTCGSAPGVAPRARAARRRRRGRARRRRLGVERARRPLLRGQAGAPRRPRSRRRRRAERARGAAARDARGGADVLGTRATSARSSRASGPTSRSGAPTGSSSAAPPTWSAGSSSRRPTGSTGCSSAAATSSADGELVPTPSRSPRAPPRGGEALAAERRRRRRLHGVESAMTVSTHVLDTERRPARRRGPRSSSGAARSSPAPARPTPSGRIRELAEAAPGDLPARLPPALALLPPGRARGRPRRGPPPHPAARLLVRVRDLPRQLSVEELAELFEGRTRFVERLAELDDPLGPRAGACRAPAGRREEGGPRRAPGDRRDDALGPLRRGAGRRRGARARPSSTAPTRSASASASSSSSTGGPRARSSPILRERLERSREQELATALDELVSIAEDRWRRS